MDSLTIPAGEETLKKAGSENGNSGDEGIDTTEPLEDVAEEEVKQEEREKAVEEMPEGVAEIEEEEKNSTSPVELAAEVEHNNNVGLKEEKTAVELAAEVEHTGIVGLQEEKTQVELASEVQQTEQVFGNDAEKSSREILLEKRSSLSHTPDIVRVFEKEAAKTSEEIHEFQKVKGDLKAVDVEEQVQELKISQTCEVVQNKTGQSQTHFKHSDMMITDLQEVTKALQLVEETREIMEVEKEAETSVKESTESENIMSLCPAPVEVTDLMTNNIHKSGKRSKTTTKLEKTASKNEKVSKKASGVEKAASNTKKNSIAGTDTDKKKTQTAKTGVSKKSSILSNGDVGKASAPDVIKEVLATTNNNDQKESKAVQNGRAKSPRSARDGVENRRPSSKSRHREKTLEKEDMLGIKKEEEVIIAKKNSFVSSREQDASVKRMLAGESSEGGLMRPTKSWLHHMAEGGQGEVPRSPSPRRRMARASTVVKPPPTEPLPVKAAAKRSASLRAGTPQAPVKREASARRRAGSEEDQSNPGVEKSAPIVKEVKKHAKREVSAKRKTISQENQSKVKVEREVPKAATTKTERKKQVPPPVAPKPATEPGVAEGVVEESLSAGEAILKFESESAAFAAVSTHETSTTAASTKQDSTSAVEQVSGDRLQCTQ